MSQKEDNTDSECSEARSDGYFRSIQPPNLLHRLECLNLGSLSVSNVSDSEMSFDSVGDNSSPV